MTESPDWCDQSHLPCIYCFWVFPDYIRFMRSVCFLTCSVYIMCTLLYLTSENETFQMMWISTFFYYFIVGAFRTHDEYLIWHNDMFHMHLLTNLSFNRKLLSWVIDWIIMHPETALSTKCVITKLNSVSKWWQIIASCYGNSLLCLVFTWKLSMHHLAALWWIFFLNSISMIMFHYLASCGNLEAVCALWHVLWVSAEPETCHNAALSSWP